MPESSLSDASVAVQSCVHLLGQLRTHLSIGEIGIPRGHFDAFGQKASTSFVDLIGKREKAQELLLGTEARFRRALSGRKEFCGHHAASFHELALSVVADAIRELSIAVVVVAGRSRKSDSKAVADRVFLSCSEDLNALASDLRLYWPTIHDAMQSSVFRSVNDKALLADVQSELAAAEHVTSGTTRAAGVGRLTAMGEWNDHMKIMLAARQGAGDWTIRQWAEELGCSIGTVQKQPMWSELQKLRHESTKSDRRQGRRTKRIDA